MAIIKEVLDGHGNLWRCEHLWCQYWGNVNPYTIKRHAWTPRLLCRVLPWGFHVKAKVCLLAWCVCKGTASASLQSGQRQLLLSYPGFGKPASFHLYLPAVSGMGMFSLRVSTSAKLFLSTSSHTITFAFRKNNNLPLHCGSLSGSCLPPVLACEPLKYRDCFWFFVSLMPGTEWACNEFCVSKEQRGSVIS